jgi:two-component system response regulator FixJ
MLEAHKLAVRGFHTGRELMAAFNGDLVDCLVLDLRLPDIEGLQLLQDIKARWGYLPPTIIVTAFGDVPSAVKAMKMGVFDFLEKPVPMNQLLELVQMGIRESHARRHQHLEFKDFVSTMARLSPREQRVLEGLLAGKPNKQIASELDLSHKTIATYRAGILRKFNAASLVQVVRMMERLSSFPPPHHSGHRPAGHEHPAAPASPGPRRNHRRPPSR